MSKMGNLRIEAEEQVEYFSKADFVKVFGSEILPDKNPRLGPVV